MVQFAIMLSILLFPIQQSFCLQGATAFLATNRVTRRFPCSLFQASNSATSSDVTDVNAATEILQAWDLSYNPDNKDLSADKKNGNDDSSSLRAQLRPAIQLLNEAARAEREADSTTGRVMLGICADDASQGLATLKSWVTGLQLPRGLLHGMDKDGVPLQLDGAVYIKYNSGGVYTFADIRKSGLGFDALWKPGDALLELYDGTYRGVYFQVELADQVFRQFLVPLDVFEQ